MESIYHIVTIRVNETSWAHVWRLRSRYLRTGYGRFVGSIRSRMSFSSESSWSSVCIPNSSQSQARFNPDEPILRPWRGDSQKHHPRSLGLNNHSLYSAQGFDDQALFPLSLKSVTIAFKRLVATTLNWPSWVVWANLLAQCVFFTV
jgi:hypothetical protein